MVQSRKKENNFCLKLNPILKKFFNIILIFYKILHKLQNILSNTPKLYKTNLIIYKFYSW